MAVSFTALAGIGEIVPGDDLARIIGDAIEHSGLGLRAGDVLVVAQKIVSKAEDRFVELAAIELSERALVLSRETGKDARIVELILRESDEILRSKPNVIIAAHRAGYVMAHAGIDRSNIGAGPESERALLLPLDCDASAEALRQWLAARFEAEIGVIISDSFGRAWRKGTVNVALGVAGLPALVDRRGDRDRNGRVLESTEIAFADGIAAGAGLAMGETDEGTPVVLVRGLEWNAPNSTGQALIRGKAEDMFRVTGENVVAISGGIGGAKLALGLYHLLPKNSLSIIVNTGDDFEHLGLAISPDIDTTLYTLADLANPELGWGRRDESWNFMAALEAVGGETWFRLGDRDLALHIERTRRLAGCETLSQVIAGFAERLGIAAQILPMSDDHVRTRVNSDAGDLAFQDYFVRRRCAPHVTEIRFEGAAKARMQPEIGALLASPEIEAIILCPSNPYLSIDPILAVPGLRAALRTAPAPVIAVTPIIGTAAVKGPTAKIMRELGIAVGPHSVADYYADFLDGFVLDVRDAAQAGEMKLPVHVADTLMTILADKIRVAEAVLAFARELRTARP